MTTHIKYLLVLLALYQPPVFAYLDPGTGSMLLSGIIGLLATALFTLKSIYYKVVGRVLALFGVKVERKHRTFVFYSEGKTYWNSFQPILEALHQRGIHATYLTSSDDDPGLAFATEYIETIYIGCGNKAYTFMNLLEADLCIMTTPGLDVLQIKRSKGVKHYAHIVHAPTDIHLYKLFSFDYYDSVLCSGPQQINTLRQLEQLRNTPAKLLLQSGCTYYDGLVKQHQQLPPRENASDEQYHVLIAPTWGSNGLLRKYGLDLLLPPSESWFSAYHSPSPTILC